MNVDGLMAPTPCSCHEHDSAMGCAWLMRRRGIDLMPVLGPGRHVVGVLVAADLDAALVPRLVASPDARSRRRSNPETPRGADLQVGQVMRRDVITCSIGDELASALGRLAATGCAHAIVTDAGGASVGVLRMADLQASLDPVEDDFLASKTAGAA